MIETIIEEMRAKREGKLPMTLTSEEVLEVLAALEVKEGPKEETKEDTSNSLPDDFPGRAQLSEAGIDTYEQVRAQQVIGLTAISGIGDATARKIEDALKG